MRILIDIGHPAHVHYFKHFAWEMQKGDHDILFTCREKEFEIYLLNYYGFKYKSFGKKYSSITGKIFGLIEFDLKEFLTGLEFKPDIFLSAGSIYAAHASWLLNKPHIALEDTFNFEQIRLYLPFTNVVLTADYEHPLRSKKVVKYSGYQELAYLHPKRFIPDKNILDELGVSENEKYVILRFVAWKATHDMGHRGISPENKIKAVREFEKFAKVFISSESKLPLELEKYKIKIKPHRMHDAIAFSTLFFGEGATMASEAAVLGVPSIILNNQKLLNTTEEETRYLLTFNFSESKEDQLRAIQKSIELISATNVKTEWQRRRENMLKDKIDVTAFLVWFVENYPESVEVVKNNPKFQFNFN